MCTSTKKVIDRQKRSKGMNKVRSVESMSKDLKCFLLQKEAPPSHKLQDHAYE